MDGVQIIIIIVNILPVVVVAIKTGATVVMIVVVERRKKVFMCRLMNAAGSSRVTSTAEGQRQHQQQPQHRMTIMRMMECGNQRTRVCEEEWEVEWCCIVRFGQSSSLVSFLRFSAQVSRPQHSTLDFFNPPLG